MAKSPDLEALKKLVKDYGQKNASDKKASLGDMKDNRSEVHRGELYAENSADVKKDVPHSVESAPEPTDSTDSNAVPLGLGLHQAEFDDMSGFDKIMETIRYNTNKDASDLSTSEGLNKRAAQVLAISDKVNKLVEETVKSVKPTEKKAGETKVDDKDTTKVAALLSEYVKFGNDRGAVAANYLRGYNEMTSTLVKMSEDGTLATLLASADSEGKKADEEDDDSDDDEGGESKEEKAPSDDTEEESAPVPNEAEVPPPVEAGPPMGGDAGGMPPGLDPAAMGGGAPPGAAPPGVPPGPDDQLNALGNGMMQTGALPPELIQLIQQLLAQQQTQGQASPEMAAKAASNMQKLSEKLDVARAVQKHMNSGKFVLREPKSAREKQMVDKAREYFSEIYSYGQN